MSMRVWRCRYSGPAWFVTPATTDTSRRSPAERGRGRPTWASKSSPGQLRIKFSYCLLLCHRWVSEKSRRKAALKELKELTKRGRMLDQSSPWLYPNVCSGEGEGVPVPPQLPGPGVPRAARPRQAPRPEVKLSGDGAPLPRPPPPRNLLRLRPRPRAVLGHRGQPRHEDAAPQDRELRGHSWYYFLIHFNHIIRWR